MFFNVTHEGFICALNLVFKILNSLVDSSPLTPEEIWTNLPVRYQIDEYRWSLVTQMANTSSVFFCFFLRF